MEKIKKRIANLKVEGKLKVYQMTVLVMTLFLVLVALISTVVISSGGSDHSCPPYKRNESIHHAGSFISGRSSCGNLYRTDPREV